MKGRKGRVKKILKEDEIKGGRRRLGRKNKKGKLENKYIVEEGREKIRSREINGRKKVRKMKGKVIKRKEDNGREGKRRGERIRKGRERKKMMKEMKGRKKRENNNKGRLDDGG